MQKHQTIKFCGQQANYFCVNQNAWLAKRVQKLIEWNDTFPLYLLIDRCP